MYEIFQIFLLEVTTAEGLRIASNDFLWRIIFRVKRCQKRVFIKFNEMSFDNAPCWCCFDVLALEYQLMHFHVSVHKLMSQQFLQCIVST